MSINKLALIRYKVIDECLQNKYRKWTLDNLVEKVSDALYEYEGIDTGVSKRTIQGDIQFMRSDKLGYNAPIVVKEQKYYTYEDAKYSITKTPIKKVDIDKLREVVTILKQFEGFSYFEEMTEVIAKLENNLYKSSKQTRNCIQFENNKQLKGIPFINPLYQAILNKKTLLLDYQSFKAKAPQQSICFPYLLKEYRNRWFLISKVKNTKILSTMALDRIVKFEELATEPYLEYEGIDFDIYYSDLIGVTKNLTDKAMTVVLKVDAANAPYILTKPLHSSQTLLKETQKYIMISICVILNFELEREILGFGESMQVISPRLLAKKLKKRLDLATNLYEDAF